MYAYVWERIDGGIVHRLKLSPGISSGSASTKEKYDVIASETTFTAGGRTSVLRSGPSPTEAWGHRAIESTTSWSYRGP